VFEPELIRSAVIAGGRLANFRRLAHLSMAGFDMACWDAAGKLVGRPIHALMGGALRREIDFYTFPLAMKPQEWPKRPGDSRRADSRSSISRSAWETSGTWKRFAGRGKRSGRQSGSRWMPTRPGILPLRRMSEELAPHDLEFIERPTDARDLLGMRDLRRTTRVPIAANQGIWSLGEAAQAIRLEACDVIMTGELWLGGLLPLQRMGSLCAET
jgi:L-alanine-DL-glutamate epimerase-like enolase superfamily enzyme